MVIAVPVRMRFLVLTVVLASIPVIAQAKGGRPRLEQDPVKWARWVLERKRSPGTQRADRAQQRAELLVARRQLAAHRRRDDWAPGYPGVKAVFETLERARKLMEAAGRDAASPPAAQKAAAQRLHGAAFLHVQATVGEVARMGLQRGGPLVISALDQLDHLQVPADLHPSVRARVDRMTVRLHRRGVSLRRALVEQAGTTLARAKARAAMGGHVLYGEDSIGIYLLGGSWLPEPMLSEMIALNTAEHLSSLDTETTQGKEALAAVETLAGRLVRGEAVDALELAASVETARDLRGSLVLSSTWGARPDVLRFIEPGRTAELQAKSQDAGALARRLGEALQTITLVTGARREGERE
jgi:hypothetical protein